VPGTLAHASCCPGYRPLWMPCRVLRRLLGDDKRSLLDWRSSGGWVSCRGHSLARACGQRGSHVRCYSQLLSTTLTKWFQSGRASMAVVRAAANHRGAPNCSLTRLDIGKWMGCRQRSPGKGYQRG
jgi:hypothetical protein